MRSSKSWLVAAAALTGLATAALAGPPHGPGGGRHIGFGGHFGHGGHFAHWGGPRLGIHWGAGPYWAGGWGAGAYWPGVAWAYAAPPAYVYGPPAVVTSTPGVVYIERDIETVSTKRDAPPPATADPDAPPGGWWYLCAAPRGFYPNVRECPGGWERIPATPPGIVR